MKMTWLRTSDAPTGAVIERALVFGYELLAIEIRGSALWQMCLQGDVGHLEAGTATTLEDAKIAAERGLLCRLLIQGRDYER